MAKTGELADDVEPRRALPTVRLHRLEAECQVAVCAILVEARVALTKLSVGVQGHHAGRTSPGTSRREGA